MVDHISRKISILLALLAISLVALQALGFRMGLDLEGGTRLVYSIDLDRALAEGHITQEQYDNPDQLKAELIGIWTTRIDPQGVKGATVRTEGKDRIVIELPGSATAARKEISAGLMSAMGVDDVALYLDPGEDRNPDLATQKSERDRITREREKFLAEFPASGGVIDIDGERVRYGKRVGNMLQRLDRGLESTQPAAHEKGATVQLKASDPWRQLIENTGSMAFMIEATNQDLVDPVNRALSSDLQKERTAVQTWIDENPGLEIREYNTLLATSEGPKSRLRWYPMVTDNPEAQLKDLIQPLIIEEDPAWRFDGTHFPTFYPSQDNLGLPAVGFTPTAEKQVAFGDFTEEHKNERMAIVINDEIVTFPEIHGRLGNGGVIEGGAGGFTSEEVNDLVRVLRSGSLVIRPDFEAQETVGASLGSDYVQRGYASATLGLVLVLVFMLVYYRKLGVIAGVSLVFNLVLLLGAMAFIRATLTLPGVAGIILTVGMAVDANILIYERIREEALRGRKPLQSARDGFGNAVSTIVDANVTTLITGLILYKVGSGPVRGFATTLCIGIITSMISALMLTRVLVHFALEKGVDSWSMMRLVTDTKIRFMDISKKTVWASLLCMVGGVGLFATVPSDIALGIEFSGGTTMTIRTESPMSVDAVRDMLDPAKNDRIAKRTLFTDSVTVKAIKSTGQGEDTYLGFRIESKGKESDQTTIRQDVMDYLAPILQKGPVEASVVDTAATGRLYFEFPHDTAEIAASLLRSGVKDAQVAAIEGSNNVYSFEGTLAAPKNANALMTDIEATFDAQKDASGGNFSLSSPVSSLDSVGAQMVEELRDNALLAILLSLFAAVMYIRVRFAEYSYGFAAVIALVHDVFIALGALAVMMYTGWIQAEINLAMIAAFLTIIGYSLNDTIVVFDRIRENLPRMKGDMATVFDRSINQTLSRTLLTSLTTLISVALLFLFNVGTGNVIEGFSFALLIGVIVGTYSSMFIATPALLWLEKRRLASLSHEEPHRKEVATSTK
ncbi:MAG: protein translocase subunit SecD [Planctomycetes bacterium]|nr:protein translocase subunit SecD [Planctomycetota bacterium]